MAVLPSSSLELTIAVPGFASTTPFPSPSGKEWMEEEEESSNNPRKKLRLTKEQSCYLEESFKQNHTLSPKQKDCLAMQLKLRPRQVEVWFQNRRARSKLKKTEMECEYLKRCFGSLTEQNRRLQRELEQLKAIKVLGPPSVISPHSSTLSMCPRCERVTTTTVTASFIDNAATPAATLSPKVSTPAL